ncbi:MAG: hypothetical protein HYY18_23190 [Planctomycetes bacterium]|nr:hypothetical protein [Planctomycetota bacterium]
MKKLGVAVALALTPLVLFAEDAAVEFGKRLKKLEQEEGLGRVALAKHCETTKMWKEAVEEWSRVLEVFPENKEGTEHLTKAQERADLVASRPTDADAAKYTQGLAALRKSMGKKYRDLAAWAKSKGLEGEAEDAEAMADEFDSVKKVSNDPKQRAIDALNRVRRKCRLKPVVLSEKLSDGAQKHADYLVKNDAHPSTKGLGAHNEDPSLPGYTEEGAKAGHQSDIGMAQPPQAMSGMLGTFYHRIPLLHPDLKEVGIGFAKFSGERGGWGGGRCVIDYSGVSDVKDEKAPRIVAYPAEGQTNVQRAFDNENPDPLPRGDEEAGIAITLTFFDEPEVKDAAVEVTGKGGVSVDGYLSSQEKPARSDFTNEHSITFIPSDPLDANVKHHVKVTAMVNGEAYVKEWDFTTGQKMAEGRNW